VTSDLVVLELVPTEGRHAGFDAPGAEGDEQQPHHGQRPEGRAGMDTVSVHIRRFSLCVCVRVCVCVCVCVFNPHVKGHVVWSAVLVCICDVMDSTYSQDGLPDRVDD